MSTPRTKTILIAVGGPTCSGKTSLVKQLCQILPEGDSFIVHQDDFAPPEAQLPYHPDHPEWQDWDHPPTAILWPEFQRALLHSKAHGEPSPEVQSHDHLNVQSEEEKKKVTVRDEAAGVWRERFAGLKKELEAEAEGGERVVFGFVDGFLLYWDERCNPLYDVSFFIRVPRESLRERRETRAQYVTQTGDVWTDPPNYHPLIVWPAYVFGHRHMFQNPDGDVEQGELVRDMGAWKKDAEQRRGGWAEGKIKELELQSGAGNAGKVDKGKGKAVDNEDQEEIEKATASGILYEFRPKEGPEGMEEMVDRALGIIFDAVKMMA
ncbi:hypothetical protein HD553DRAFT_312324 [Filobasidium floriforme]|uniref:uncharacterized protein n=1 Tax=Filobasidium floriforme TaxID=5210 RepID=UPI001E8D7254|nr:uncharacterized protein HD553DRAFT_312324 [Filobasidium floriforme]KAH8084197.1 hypothetical protein HD553DRAFT_312324 [Filobasidium floriforme]